MEKKTKFQKEVDKYIQENPEIFNKITGNLTAKQKELVKKQANIKVKFSDLYKGYAPKLNDMMYSNIELDKVEKTLEIMNERHKLNERKIEYKVDKSDKIKEVYEKLFKSNAIAVPFENITPIVSNRTYNNGHKVLVIEFVPLNSDVKFDMRQDTSLLNATDYSHTIFEDYSIVAALSNKIESGNFRNTFDVMNNSDNFNINSYEDFLELARKKIQPADLKNQLLNTSKELFEKNKDFDVQDKFSRFFLNYSQNGKLIQNALHDPEYSVTQLSKGNRGLTDIYKDVLKDINFKVSKAIINIERETLNQLKELGVMTNEQSLYTEKFMDSTELYLEKPQNFPIPPTIRDIFPEQALNGFDVDIDLNDFRDYISQEVNLPVKEDFDLNLMRNPLFTRNIRYKMCVDVDICEFMAKPLRECPDLHDFMKANDIKKLATKENVLVVKNSDKDTVIKALNNLIEDTYSKETTIGTTISNLNKQIKEYSDVMKVQIDLEHTVRQDTQYASIFNDKKNINKQTLEKMENSPFKEFFKSVEYDNDVNFSSFKRNSDVEMTLNMDELENVVKDLKPVFDKLNLSDINLKFRKLGNLQKSNNKEVVQGVYIPKHKCIAIDINKSNSYNSLMHEIGHHLDYTFNDTKVLSTSMEFSNILNIYNRTYDNLIQKEPVLAVGTVENYLKSPTEVFARSFEFYLDQIGLTTEFNKNGEQINSIQNGYIFNEMSTEQKDTIVSFMDSEFNLKEPVLETTKNRIDRMKPDKPKDIDIDVDVDDVKLVKKELETKTLKTPKKEINRKTNEDINI